jgi:hypothetical protein
MKHIKKLNELKLNNITEHDYLVEMARINNIKDFPYDVFVYGGDSYGDGRNEHGEPHFHFSDKIKGGEYQFSVLIPSVEEWKQSKELYISETSNGDYIWTGLRNEKKSIISWLDEINYYDNSKKNIEMIRLQWNILNIDNKNVKQISRIK